MTLTLCVCVCVCVYIYIYIFFFFSGSVTKSGGLTASHTKANKEARLVKRQVCFILDVSIWDEAEGISGGWTPVQRPTSPAHWQSVGKNFYSLREGAACRNSTVSFDGHLEIGLISHILIVLSTENHQSQGQFLPFSLRPLLEMVAPLVPVTDWSSCS